MKRIILTMIILSFAFIINAQSVLKGIIKDKDNKPVPSVIISVKDTASSKIKGGTITDAKGEFYITLSAGDKIIVSNMGYTSDEFTISNKDIHDGIMLKMDNNSIMKKVALAGGSVSPKSYWVGAKVGYNFDGFSEDDLDNYFVGAAKVILNQSKKTFLKGEWGVVGNIAGFISSQNKDDVKKGVEKMALSVQGLGVGLYDLWEQKTKSKNCFREYFTAGYRLNTFKNVGKDSITVNLSQFKLTAGLEFEAINFEKEGSLNFSAEVSYLRFSENKYNTVFGEKKSSLISFEAGAILPINSNLGFFASGTFAPQIKPVYLFGVIVKSN